jgi:hypothetical protein
MKKGIKKIEICDSLVNRDRSSDAFTLVQDDIFNNLNSKINFQSLIN